MELFHLFSLLIVLSASFAYLNFRFLRLPNTIGLMLVSLLFSLSILGFGHYFPSFRDWVADTLESLHFSELLLEGMLSFMLFAGAIHVKYKDLAKEKLSILLLSTLSVVISTVLIGLSAFYVLNFWNIKVTLLQSLLFGSLISPTDPIAVLSILKKAGVSKSLETKIAGESLFNDGMAVVLFITLLNMGNPHSQMDVTAVLLLFGTEGLGGIALGIVLGTLAYWLMASIDSYQVEVLLTLAIVMGGYTLSHYLHVSGPLAMVMAGIIVGNHGVTYGMSEITEEYIHKFWELLDEILNTVLFVLIGLEILVVEISQTMLLISGLFVLVSLVARYISVFIPSLVIRLKERITRKTLVILTWGGLRGGVSIALSLSIPSQYNREVWVTITYVIVCFSILVQGLTIGKVASPKRAIAKDKVPDTQLS